MNLTCGKCGQTFETTEETTKEQEKFLEDLVIEYAGDCMILCDECFLKLGVGNERPQ